MNYKIYEKVKEKSRKCIKNLYFKASLVILVIIILVIILPSLAELYAGQVHLRADSSQMNLSRSELLKILVSLISPVLTFFIFKNTLEVQRESLKRRNIDDVNRDFYGLIDIFSKHQQNDIGIIKWFYDVNIESNTILKIDNTDEKSDSDPDQYYIYDLFPENAVTPNEGRVSIYSSEVATEDLKVNYIINVQFDSVHNILSSYFKVLHRIIKNLNENVEKKVIDKSMYLNYIGILRAQISSIELVVILFHSLYAYRGLGLGVELIGSDFFGDERDFKLEQHFEFPKPRITKEDMGIFVFDNNNNMINRRKKLRIELQKMSEEVSNQEQIVKVNFKKFTKTN